MLRGMGNLLHAMIPCIKSMMMNAKKMCISVKASGVETALIILSFAKPCMFTVINSSSEGVGGDYSPPSGRYSLEAGETSDCLEVTIFNDIIFESVEEFIGQLVGFEVDGSIQATIPGVILQPQRTMVEITDNDGN